MKLAVLFSGGKDSTLALAKAVEFGHEVVCLISIVSENEESYMFHVPNIHITKLQAEAMDIPIIQFPTKGAKELELEDLKRAIQEAINIHKIEGIVTGAVNSTYQGSRIQRICHDLDLWCFNPLWLLDQLQLLQEITDRKFHTIISGVFAYPLDESFLGRNLDKDLIRELGILQEEYQLNPAGEGGELETTVLDAPFFKKKIVIKDTETTYEKHSGVYKILHAELQQK